MTIPPNAILAPAGIRRVDLETLPGVTVRRGKEDDSRRQLVKLFRRETAAEFVGDFTHGSHLCGVSKGQFSLLDVLAALSDRIGRCALTLSTWTIGRNDVTALQQLQEVAGALTTDRFSSMRFLVDVSFIRREPGIVAHLRKTYGDDCIRVSQNHAKFALMTGGDWRVIVRTSMNLNGNPRLEFLEVKDDPALHDFFDEIVTSFFTQHEAKHQIAASVRTHSADFRKLGGA